MSKKNDRRYKQRYKRNLSFKKHPPEVSILRDMDHLNEQCRRFEDYCGGVPPDEDDINFHEGAPAHKVKKAREAIYGKGQLFDDIEPWKQPVGEPFVNLFNDTFKGLL